MPERIIRASEIGEYLFCKRAWWLRLQGIQPANHRALEAGTAFHGEEARKAVAAGCLRTTAIVFFLLAVVFAAIGLTNILIR
jgi:hypothetical protein